MYFLPFSLPSLRGEAGSGSVAWAKLCQCAMQHSHLRLALKTQWTKIHGVVCVCVCSSGASLTKNSGLGSSQKLRCAHFSPILAQGDGARSPQDGGWAGTALEAAAGELEVWERRIPLPAPVKGQVADDIQAQLLSTNL